MLFATLVVLLITTSGTAASTAAPPPAIALRQVAGGSFLVDIADAHWFDGAPPSFLLNSYLYTPPTSLVLVANSSGSGEDAIGSFSSTTLEWTTVGGPSPGAAFETSFITYAGGAAVQLVARFPRGAVSQTGAGAGIAGGLASTFPSLALAPSATELLLSSIYQAPKSGNCGWTVNAAAAFPVPSGALLVLAPLNASAPRAAVGIAALTEQTAMRQAVVPTANGGHALALGPGAEFTLDAGFTARTLIVAVAAASAPPPTLLPPAAAASADLGFPAGGPGAALHLLGDALLAFHNKSRPAMNFDRIHSGLGVSTTTFYFYNPCDCGRWANNTCPPDDGSNPGRVPNCMTYADSLERVVSDWRSRAIPFSHILLDSFWYGEGVFGGASEWTDDPALMAAVHSFPRSLHNFSDTIGRDISVWAHNGHFVETSPYLKRFPFRGLMPQGPALWRELFAANAAGWGLRGIKQDHVGETIASVEPITDPKLIADWWGGMGIAAAENGVSIQYCCSPPLVLFNSLNVPAATGARSSPDYVLVGEHDTTPRTLFQWANGAEAAFHFAIGLMPDKDGFFSNSTEMQQAWKYVPSAAAPPFYNFTEVSPLRHATAALLCGGPVHVGDAISATNETLVRALMRADGVLLRGSRPHAAVDAQWRSMASGGWAAAALPALHAHAAPPPPVAKPDESFANNGIGEVYSTVSLVPAGGGVCVRYTVVTATGVSQPLSLHAADLALDAVALKGAACTANGGAWVAFEWNLVSFAPASTPEGAVRRVFTGAGGAVDEIPIASTAKPRHSDPPQMIIVAPVVEGWVVLGEVGKLLPVSPQRIVSLAPVAGAPGAVAVAVSGGVGESVTLAACQLEAASGACSHAPAFFTCNLSADTPIGYATLTLDAAGKGTCT